MDIFDEKYFVVALTQVAHLFFKRQKKIIVTGALLSQIIDFTKPWPGNGYSGHGRVEQQVEPLHLAGGVGDELQDFPTNKKII